MLKKLVKHDFVAIGRFALPILGAEIILILITGLVCRIPFRNPILNLFPTLLFIISIFISILAMMALFILPIVRFYKNFVSGEGYLTFTLPVTTHQLLLSKLITGGVTLLVNVLVYFGGLVFLLSSFLGTFDDGDVFREIWNEIVNDLFSGSSKGSIALIVIVFILFFLVSLIWSQLMYYLSISLGQVLCKNKLLGAFVAYLVISFVVQIITFALVLIIALIAGFSGFVNFMNSGDGLIIIYGIMGIESIILSIISYFIIHRCLTKKLNLN